MKFIFLLLAGFVAFVSQSSAQEAVKRFDESLTSSYYSGSILGDILMAPEQSKNLKFANSLTSFSFNWEGCNAPMYQGTIQRFPKEITDHGVYITSMTSSRLWTEPNLSYIVKTGRPTFRNVLPMSFRFKLSQPKEKLPAIVPELLIVGKPVVDEQGSITVDEVAFSYEINGVAMTDRLSGVIYSTGPTTRYCTWQIIGDDSPFIGKVSGFISTLADDKDRNVVQILKFDVCNMTPIQIINFVRYWSTSFSPLRN